MLVLRKNNHLFLCKEYNITVYAYGKKLRQSININCIRITAYRNYTRFWAEIEESKPREFDTFADIITLAAKYHMNIEAGYSWPTEEILSVKKNRSCELC